MRAVIDTNVLVYDTFEDSLHHEGARRLLDSLDLWVIPLIVMYEYVWFMRGAGVDPRDVAGKIEEYASPERARVRSAGLEGIRWALSAVLGEGLSLSRFNDKVVLRVAISEGTPLASYDSALRRQAAAEGIQVLPRTITGT